MNTDKRRWWMLAFIATSIVVSAKANALTPDLDYQLDDSKIETYDEKLDGTVKPAFAWTTACFEGKELSKELLVNVDAPKQIITVDRPFRTCTGGHVKEIAVAGEIVSMKWQFPETTKLMRQWTNDSGESFDHFTWSIALTR